ncbi:MAG TPA: hypothetical protein DCQ26_05215 [Marinilabiliales bacterium]|jgi:hypothetical protein|nr:MAG: hypothetical protein A2W84_09405 [Bacteroidetes bacterium GWC2_40_13]OFX73928.1 MAG: hypothetical protein A2W96_11445 [Bacteroidetes bacterium GWD2_40_43]OFX93238.1 MAG: hypothetical protein A2W97_06625 [Bacteroidetes bacterium GWE2_40_63]OFY17700.1 MAG: hypothetical protein A2W88_00925 [Bacteroidetes bacterium GWF2_40_13]HAM97988.1 hypothetical protein [Marinilabiliales bacterium]
MKHLLGLMLIICTYTGFAQDKIVKTTGDVVNCKVSEILSDEIKYYYTDNPKIIFGIDKTLVDRIEFATGETIKIDGNSFDNSEYYANQRKRALKINFLSPLLGSTELVYEQNIKPGKSWETAIGIIGLGFDTYELNSQGIYGKLAYKFMRTPNFYTQRMHYAHIMKGAYFAPELAFRYAKYDYEDWDYYNGGNTTRKEDLALAFTLKFGKQWVFDDALVVDTFFGVGYGFSKDNKESIPYGFAVFDNEFPIALTYGLRIGWAF